MNTLARDLLIRDNICHYQNGVVYFGQNETAQ